MPVARSIRTSLLTNVLALVLAAGVAIGGTIVLGTRSIVRRLSSEVIDQALEHSETRLRAFFEPVAERLGEIRRWSSRGLVDLDDPIAMTRLLAPMVAEMEQVSSIMVASEDGREVMVLEGPAGWRTRHTDIGRWTEYDWQNDSAEAEPRDLPDLGYDPRERPWFIGAMNPAGDGAEGAGRLSSLAIAWTEPYTFFTTGDPGMTASLAFDAADGTRLVTGLDVLLNDISSFTTELAVGRSGMVIVVDDHGRVIGLPRSKRFESLGARRQALLSPPSEIGVSAIRSATAAITPGADAEKPITVRPTIIDQSVRFTDAGEAWWGQVRPFELSAIRQLWIAVVVPEHDLLGRFAALRWTVIGVVALAFLVAVVQAFALARRFSAPFEALVRENDRIGAGDLEPGTPVASTVREVRQLAGAQDRMRASLRTLVRVERDLAVARDIQQATLPSEFPNLPGYDVFGVTRPADETGGDTFDVFGYRDGAGWRQVVTSGKLDGAILMLADATGHGVGPALAAVQMRAMIRIASALGETSEAAAMMQQINERLCADLPENRFITAWLGELDVSSHTLRSFSAGQAPLLHLARGGTEARWLDADAPPFGIVAGIAYDDPIAIELDPGDLFVVLSDGFYEEPNAAGEQFGRGRVLGVLREHRHCRVESIVDALREAVEEHTGGAAPRDDRTAVIVRRDD